MSEGKWEYELRLADVFHDEDRPFLLRRDIIVERIKAAPFYDEDDWTLPNIVDEMAFAEDSEDFDGWWDEFYDWADAHGVWVRTRTPVPKEDVA